MKDRRPRLRKKNRRESEGGKIVEDASKGEPWKGSHLEQERLKLVPINGAVELEHLIGHRLLWIDRCRLVKAGGFAGRLTGGKHSPDLSAFESRQVISFNATFFSILFHMCIQLSCYQVVMQPTCMYSIRITVLGLIYDATHTFICMY